MRPDFLDASMICSFSARSRSAASSSSLSCGSFAISVHLLWEWFPTSPPVDAEPARFRHRGVVDIWNREPEDRARVARIDDPVVGAATGVGERGLLALDLVLDGLAHARVLLLVE